MKNLKKYSLYIAIGVVGILLGALIFGGTETKVELQTPDEHIADSHTDDEGNVIYSCSMHPSVRQNEPGDCPICGMELIPVNDNSTGGNPNELTMSLAAMKLAEIETSVVRSGNPVSTIYLPGKIMPDQNKVSSVTALFGGRIVKLYVDYEGAFVRKGQKIASIYSPELISAQQELLQAAKFKEQNPVLYKSAKRKLALWELPAQTIENIESTGEIKTEIDIVSPATGYVTKLNVSREDYVNRGSMMYMIADLSSVWVMFDAYESDLSLIEEGQNIMFTTATYPGEKFEGTVSFVDPSVNNMSRTADVRVKANNPDKKLKPNMLAEGILTANISNQRSLLIPKSAVLWTGPRSIVFVQIPEKEEPTFIAREVTLGKRVGEQYIILEGLEAGEEVVTRGNFKLDGAAQLADKLSMMNRNPGTGANRTGHEGHNMGAEGSGEMQMEMNPSSMNEESMDMKMDEEDHSNHQNMNTETKPVPAEFKSQLNNVVQEYLKLKDGLVMSDKSKVSASANKVENELKNVDMTLVKGEMHSKWMDHLGKIDSSIKDLKKSQNLENQRGAFLLLSKNLIESVKTFGLPGIIYQQYCPMTDGGKGGYWLSESEEIKNPYFGEQMLKCGETITKIES
ncbi:MAG: efflux RND transporter periplasmic adaptor subunit [Balneola sp.]|nr:efflux RND transporter periplasmic adaptor subunit [Balneola sp.]MBO6649505.1 efflux RND transporter periplasmic adaptor subunit [Balneola sp.]MBO6711321.1 efflux RND transporter periplasmic adaptor subunit [Balneola sp.]MBO6800563.1 efflux RND transporter periplasmic adaptor subunit [Balneola sp.]MBO6869257.1 efflux RND transporter periplasmic adaptor subunit [Balneola sp.]